MSAAPDVTAKDFDETIASGVTLVDFWAEWCAPCKMIAPRVDELAAEYDGKAKVVKVNVDNEPNLAMRFDVSSIPTLLVFKDGELVERMIGAKRKEEIAQALDAAVA